MTAPENERLARVENNQDHMRETLADLKDDVRSMKEQNRSDLKIVIDRLELLQNALTAQQTQQSASKDGQARWEARLAILIGAMTAFATWWHK